MEWFQNYLAYLKDNPKGYWFKRKLYGWGWTPATWQGWVSILVYLLIIIGLALRLDPLASPETLLQKLVLPVVIFTILLILLSWSKGEPPRWQWGIKKEDENKK